MKGIEKAVRRPQTFTAKKGVTYILPKKRNSQGEFPSLRDGEQFKSPSQGVEVPLVEGDAVEYPQQCRWKVVCGSFMKIAF